MADKGREIKPSASPSPCLCSWVCCEACSKMISAAILGRGCWVTTGAVGQVLAQRDPQTSPQNRENVSCPSPGSLAWGQGLLLGSWCWGHGEASRELLAEENPQPRVPAPTARHLLPPETRWLITLKLGARCHVETCASTVMLTSALPAVCNICLSQRCFLVVCTPGERRVAFPPVCTL